MSRRRLVLYLDQSDLSDLASRRGPNGQDYAQVRNHLVDLSRRGVVRVRTSVAHLIESLGLDWRRRRELRQLLLELPDAGFSRAYPGQIWEAELNGEAPVLGDVRIATTTPLFWASFVFFTSVSRPLSAMETWLRREIKKESQRVPADLQKVVSRAIIEGDPDLLPGGKRLLRNRIAYLVQRRAWRSLQNRGHDHPFGFLRAYKRGVSGFGVLDERIRDAADLTGSPQRAAMKPACAVSIAVRRSVGADLQRVDERSDDMDAMHVAYAVYSDVATVDKRVMSAVKPFEKHLDVRLWPTGKLEGLVEAIERGVGSCVTPA